MAGARQTLRKTFGSSPLLWGFAILALAGIAIVGLAFRAGSRQHTGPYDGLKAKLRLGMTPSEVQQTLGAPYIAGIEHKRWGGKSSEMYSLWVYMDPARPSDALRVLFVNGRVTKTYTSMEELR